MKEYKKAELIAKNLPTGSYVAGCPTHTKTGTGQTYNPDKRVYGSCAACEVTM